MLHFFFLVIFSFGSFAKTLVYCSEASPDYFNPQLSVSGSTFDATRLIYNRLVELSEDRKKLTTGLSHKWKISKKGKVYTFFLRKDVSFHENKHFKPTRLLNAEDVVWSFERQRSKKHPYHLVNGGAYKFFYALNLQNLILKVEAIGEYQVRFVLKKPHALFLSYLAMEFGNILSKEYGELLLKKDSKEKLDFEPIGTGPFVFKKYVKDNLIRYARNEKYYLAPASLKKIVFSITPDPTVRFQKLKRGECHLIANPQPLDIAAMKKHKNIKVLEGVTYNVSYLGLNTKKPPLHLTKVRKALAHALNRSLYIKAVYKGLAQVAEGPLPPSLWGHDSRLRMPEHSIEKAKKLLKEAGYEKGLELELWTLPVSRPYNPNGKKLGELIQADLKKVGVKVKLITFDWPTYLAKSSKGEHQLIQMGWKADLGDPSNFLDTLLTCKAIASGANLARWCQKKYDTLIEEAFKGSLSQKKRALLYKRAQRIFQKEMPWIPLAHAYGFAAFSKNLKGYRLKTFGSEAFYPLSFK